MKNKFITVLVGIAYIVACLIFVVPFVLSVLVITVLYPLSISYCYLADKLTDMRDYIRNNMFC